MANPSKSKGSAAERAVVDYLRTAGWPHAERRLAGSQKDRGDIAGVVGVVLEVKAEQRTDLAGWTREAAVERDNDHADYGIVIAKRRGTTDVGQWYAILTVDQLAALLTQAGYGGTTPARDGVA